jgi:hypothetical protein
MQDIKLGDTEFDSKFAVASSSEQSARAALTPEVRRLLVSLPGGGMEAGLDGGRAYIEVRYAAHRAEELDSLIRAVVSFAREADKA